MDAKQVSVSRNWLFVYVLTNNVLFVAIIFILYLVRPEDATAMLFSIAGFGMGISGIAGAFIPMQNRPPINTDEHR